MVRSPSDEPPPSRGRRARREANDTLLARSCGASDLDSADLTELFSYSPHPYSGWAVFVSLPESSRVLRAPPRACIQPRAARPEKGAAAALRAAERALLRVEPGVRDLLSQGFNEGLVRKIESDVRGLEDEREVSYVLESARDRCVLHGCARYYGLKSRSFDRERRRVTVVKAEGGLERPTVQLADLMVGRGDGDFV